MWTLRCNISGSFFQDQPSSPERLAKTVDPNDCGSAFARRHDTLSLNGLSWVTVRKLRFLSGHETKNVGVGTVRPRRYVKTLETVFVGQFR